ncbi:MAG: NAD-dependent epimerase/dehydratase family protein [Candidatus Omnitrophota bacterium]
MKILITGGAGMAGSHAAEYFAAKKNSRVMVLDNLCRSSLFGCKRRSVEFNWEYLRRFSNVRRIIGDIRDLALLKKTLSGGVDAVIHAAGQPGVPSSIRMPEEDFSVNAAGTLSLLEAVRKYSPRAGVIFCSTNKVYGENVDGIPSRKTASRYVYREQPKGVTETMPVDNTGHTPYGASKLCADIYVQEYGRIFGLNTAVFRMSCIYGTRQFGFEEQGWVAWFAAAALLGRGVTIYGDGRQVRDLLYAADLSEAFDKCLASPGKNMRGEVYNIGGGKDNTVSLREMLFKLERLSGRRIKTRFAPWRQSDQKVYISDTSKAARMLGWKPRVGVDDGIARLFKWTKENIGMFR